MSMCMLYLSKCFYICCTLQCAPHNIFNFTLLLLHIPFPILNFELEELCICKFVVFKVTNMEDLLCQVQDVYGDESLAVLDFEDGDNLDDDDYPLNVSFLTLFCSGVNVPESFRNFICGVCYLDCLCGRTLLYSRHIGNQNKKQSLLFFNHSFMKCNL